jgi:photosystem II stability/assembly factor-like uncharacterized protein
MYGTDAATSNNLKTATRPLATKLAGWLTAPWTGLLPFCIVSFTAASLLLPSERLMAEDQAGAEFNSQPMQRTDVDDADLADVFFVDGTNGWAVGDHGAVWRTTNGGRTWRSQPTPVDCRLYSVWFADEPTGWAAGGEHDPYSSSSRAELLRTDDGGWHWSRMEKIDLPVIHAIRFISRRRGIAAGESSALHPSGICTTRDGGRNWTPVGASTPTGWSAVSLSDASGGLLVGHDGTVARWTGAGFAPVDAPPFDGRRPRAVWAEGESGWIVGEGGLVIRFGHETGSVEALDVAGPAASSESPTGPLAGFRYYDLRAVGAVGTSVWVAGRPGTHIFHSVDGGKTWLAHETGQALPINDMFFTDEHHGWAVGAMGTILSTQDGGESWRVQRGEGRRAAWLAVFSRPEDVPFEWIAELGAEKGYRGVVEIANRRYTPPTEVGLDGRLHADDPRAADVAALLHEATVRAGGCGAEMAWAFPLPASGLRLQPDRIAPAWSQLNEGASLAALHEWIARSIRIWRPDVVLTHPATHLATTQLEQTMGSLVLTAVDKADRTGDVTDHLASLGLRPWRVTKVFGVTPAGESGTCTTTPWRLSPTLGRSPASLAIRTRGVLSDRFMASADRVDLSLYVNNLSQGVGERDVFSGIHLAASGDARRGETALHAENVQGLRLVARKHRNITALLTRFAADESQTFGVLGEVGRLTDELDDEAAALVLYQLAHQFAAQGRWRLAEEALARIVGQYADSTLARAARDRLVALRTSGEVAWTARRQEAAQQSLVESASGTSQRQMSAWGGFTSPNSLPTAAGAETAPSQTSTSRAIAYSGRLNLNPANFNKTGDVPGQPGATSSATSSVPPVADRNSAWSLLRFDVGLRGDPATLFAMAAAARQSGDHEQAGSLLREILGVHQDDHWTELARAEEWLAERARSRPGGKATKEIAPIDSLSVKATSEKPRLDGRLDDPMWRVASEATLNNELDVGGFGAASVRFAYDDAYLYVAVRCEKCREIRYVAETMARPRDADVDAREHFELWLDVDRDYRTAYQLAVDHRGWTSDRCWDSPAWNPTWYVAADGDDEVWTVEAAIRWTDLVEIRPAAGDAWAVVLRRIVPRVGIESWRPQPGERPAAHEFGLLRFE